MPDPVIDRFVSSYSDWMLIAQRESNGKQAAEETLASVQKQLLDAEKMLVQNGLSLEPSADHGATPRMPVPSESAESASSDENESKSTTDSSPPSAQLASRRTAWPWEGKS